MYGIHCMSHSIGCQAFFSVGAVSNGFRENLTPEGKQTAAVVARMKSFCPRHEVAVGGEAEFLPGPIDLLEAPNNNAWAIAIRWEPL